MIHTVDVIILLHLEESRHEIVLGSGVGLNDVPSLAADIQVVDLSIGSNALGSGGYAEHEATVLEGAASLGCVQGQSVVVPINLMKGYVDAS